MEEIWLAVVGFEGFAEVSSLGSVRTLDRMVNGKKLKCKPLKGRVLKQKLTKFGYKEVTLSVDGVMKFCKVHRLVAETFLANPEGLEMVHHKNSVRDDNRLENLMWCSASFNIQEGFRSGFKVKNEDHAWAKLTNEQVEYIKDSERTGPDLGEEFGVSRQTINMIKAKKTWKYL